MKEAATPQQMRVMEVNEALAPAYQKASTLVLTEAEINGLMLPFTDDKVEIRPHDGLIYIPHIHISNRLNAVFNPGQWSLICRRHWMEQGTMYGEYILLIKGCYVGESVGGHPYQPNNPKTNYSDSLESTAAEALRRICGKRLSCGSQVWDPEYAKKWVEKYGVHEHGKWRKNMRQSPAATPAQSKTTAVEKPEPPKKEQPHKIPPSLDKLRARFFENLSSDSDNAAAFMREIGWLLPNEYLEDLDDKWIPRDKDQYDRFIACMHGYFSAGEINRPYEQHTDEMHTHTKAGTEKLPGMSRQIHEGVEKDPSSKSGTTKEVELQGIRQGVSSQGKVPQGMLSGVRRHQQSNAPSRLQQTTDDSVVMQETSPGDSQEVEEWRSYPVPHGKNAGVLLKDLEKNILYGFWANYTVSDTFEKDGRTIRLKPETIAKNRKFRQMLDDAGRHYDFKKKD